MYIRMMKSPFDNQCKLCLRPFLTFRWRPGNKGKALFTEVCQPCAKMRNACQSCILDLVYKLPVQIRDQIEQMQSSTPQPIASVSSDFGKAPPVPKLVGVARTLRGELTKEGLTGGEAKKKNKDGSQTTLYIGGVGEHTRVDEVKEAMEQWGGKVKEVRIVSNSKCAFVEYGEAREADDAFTKSGGTVTIGPAKIVCQVNWAKTGMKKTRTTGAAGGARFTAPPPPPGILLGEGAAAFYPSANPNAEGTAPNKK